MKHLLVMVMSISIGINLYFFTRPSLSSAPNNVPLKDSVKVTHREGTNRNGEIARLRFTVKEQERELTAARKELSTVKGIDPAAVIVHTKESLLVKLQKIATLSSKKQKEAEYQLAQLIQNEGDFSEIVALLRNEGDPAILLTLAGVICQGNRWEISSDILTELLNVLPYAEPVERRQALASLCDRVVTRNHRTALLDWLRRERDERVICVLTGPCSGLSYEYPDEVFSVLWEVVGWLPQGDARRAVFKTIGNCNTNTTDGIGSLFCRWDLAAGQDLRDDIASAIAHTGNMDKLFSGDVSTEGPDRFLTLYRQTSDLKVRQDLIDSTGFGLILYDVNGDRGKAANFLRTVAVNEPDPILRGRLHTIAHLLESQPHSFEENERLRSMLYGEDQP